MKNNCLALNYKIASHDSWFTISIVQSVWHQYKNKHHIHKILHEQNTGHIKHYSDVTNYITIILIILQYEYSLKRVTWLV